MKTSFRFVAPAGAPISFADAVRAAIGYVTPGNPRGSVEAAAREAFGMRHAVMTSSGRAALTVVLRALARLTPRRNEVIVPSYTCHSVAAAVVRAGLRPRIVDVAPETLDFDQEALDRANFGNVLALVACSLYGLPSDLAHLEGVARRHGIFLVDDAAQSLGARTRGRLSGTWGDAGIFSFDKGKNVSAAKGGLNNTPSDGVADAIGAELTSLPAAGVRETAAAIATAVASMALLRSRLYWIPNAVPALGLGKTVYSTDFAVSRQGRALSALALVALRKLETLTRVRRANAAALASATGGLPGIRQICPLPGSEPVYLRYPVLLSSGEARRQALARLHAAGIGGSPSYPTSIADIPELRGIVSGDTTPAGGRHVAAHILTLPTHPFVTAGDVKRAAAVLAGADANNASSGVPARVSVS